MIRAVRSFFDLLPSRLAQALIGSRLRRLRARLRRRKAFPMTEQVTDTPRRMYVDLAVISQHDAGTGIQRVVRALALAMIGEDSGQWDIRFVAAGRRRAYHVISWPEPGATVDPTEIEGRPGDVFFGLDFSLDTVRRHRRQLARFRRNGGSLWFLIYDLLPVERPEWFSPNAVVRYKAWLEILAGNADGFLCISQQTETDLRRVLDQRFGLPRGYLTGVVPMSHSIRESAFREAPSSSSTPSLRIDTASPFSLMVGTLEPRKGHADILAAFDALWQQGAHDRLVIVGQMGWQTDGLRNAIRYHPEHGSKLIWLDDVEDPELERIYQACQGVIIGSHAEGFGLPLIEALGHGRPVLARDLPIFRVHEERGVRYFPADANPQILAGCIRDWSKDVQAGRIAVVRPSAGWKDSARTVLSSIAGADGMMKF